MTPDNTPLNRHEIAKLLAAVIFRHYPARAQSYVGERLQQEGWYDEDGWEVPNWFGDKKVVIGANLMGEAYVAIYENDLASDAQLKKELKKYQ